MNIIWFRAIDEALPGKPDSSKRLHEAPKPIAAMIPNPPASRPIALSDPSIG
jgi:hypothetical protein